MDESKPKPRKRKKRQPAHPSKRYDAITLKLQVLVARAERGEPPGRLLDPWPGIPLPKRK